MKKNYEEIEHLKSEASSPKDRLMVIANSLYDEGAVREAKSLETIIARLEEWQNK